jgi:hypothetical protein
MKRVLLALLAGFVFVAPAMAQSQIIFDQTGKVTHEMQADGFTMGHPSLPLNSKVMVVNTLTRREIEVTVIRNIKSSPDRIADLSQSAWLVLGLSSANSEVRIYLKAPEPQSSAAQSANKPVESVPAQTGSQNLPAQTGSQNLPAQTSSPPAAESSETLSRLDRLLDILMEREARDLRAQQEKEALEAKQREEEAQREKEAQIAKEREKAQQEKEALEAQINKVLDALKERDANDAKEREKAQQEKEALEAKKREEEAQMEKEAQIAKEREKAQQEKEALEAQISKVLDALKERDDRDAKEREKAQQDKEVLEAQISKILDALKERDANDAKERDRAQQEDNVIDALLDESAFLARETRPPAVNSAPPSVSNPARPPVYDSAPPSLYDSAPPSVYNPARPPVYDSAPPSLYDSAPPSVYNPARPPVYDSAPPPVYNPAPPVYNPVQPLEVKIIPSLPDPNNGKIYNLQVGAFSTREAAMDLSIKLRGASFDVSQEFTGALYRVIVKDIPSYMVYYAAQRLGAVGIKEIWIK